MIFYFVSLSTLIVVLIIILKTEKKCEKWTVLPQLNTMTLQTRGKMIMFNPSIEHYSDNMLVSICRKSNASECSTRRRDSSIIWRAPALNENVVIFLNKKTLKMITFNDFNLPEPAGRARLFDGGIEDIRIFNYNNNLWFIGTTRDYNPEKKYEIILSNGIQSYTSTQINEKNWIPIIAGRRLYFIRNFNPFEIIEFTAAGNFVRAHYARDSNYLNYRGNTPFIKTARGLLGIVHLKNPSKTRAHEYMNYFILLDPKFPFSILQVSPAFSLTGSDIEFYTGLIKYTNDTILVSYGVNDCAAHFSEINLNEIWKFMDNKWEAQ